MRAFHFSLEKILDLRTYRFKEAERRLAEKVGICAQLENAILNRRDLMRLHRLELAGLDFQDRWAVERYISRLAHEVQKLTEEFNKAVVERERAAQEFRTALAQKKSLENLKTKLQQRHKKESRRYEVLQADDQFQSYRGGH